jgi:hypothetical protein
LVPSFAALPDSRKKQGKQYRIDELMMGGLTLFLLKEGSRNQLNNNRRDGHFSKHFQNLTGMNLSHMDTVNVELCKIPFEVLDQLKMDLMSGLFEQKCLRDFRLLDEFYLVGVDATGIVSFDERHCEHCMTMKKKEGKDGRKLEKPKTVYFHNVLEAKLLTKSGLALSLASEWIENPVGEYKKQDCERNAFIRLAAKLKKQYPRLPICILADSLYPYENAFKICEGNGWKFIFALKDTCLKTVQEELTLTRLSQPDTTCITAAEGYFITQEYRFQTGIKYHEKYTLNWIECNEKHIKIEKSGEKTKVAKAKSKPSHFEYVTNIVPDKDNVREIGCSGRLRWKIENEGFNTQKCSEYELEHKYCRKSYNGMKNYYTLLQIAHAINQFIEKGKHIGAILKRKPKETITNLWKNLRGYLIHCKPFIINLYSEIVNENERDMQPRPAPA